MICAVDSRHTPCFDRPAEIRLVDPGVVRVMGLRTLVAVCIDCPARFESTDKAADHVRGARHRVQCDQRSPFTLAPPELLDGVR